MDSMAAMTGTSGSGSGTGGEGGGNIPVPGWNAHRHPQDPLRPPDYLMQTVPKCSKDLKGSVLQEIRDRDHFKESMAEMVLLCTEAMRRTSATRCPSKPLSLEYIADRLDVDDPCFGYLIRSSEGLLQGFITVTTFTNWQNSFRWDSLHELAFYYDDSESEDDEQEEEEHAVLDHSPKDNGKDNGKDNELSTTAASTTAAAAAAAAPHKPARRRPQTKTTRTTSTTTTSRFRHRHRPRKERRVDRDGTLAAQLQQTVRFGDPYNEGIVWPRIAEISLLGGLGCGRTLVQLVVEQLEFQKASAMANYDYLALQATDNSIPFYESLGFVRVGAVTYETTATTTPNAEGATNSEGERLEIPISTSSSSDSRSGTSNSNSEGSAAVAELLPPCSPDNPNAMALPSDIVSSPSQAYEVQRPGESPNDIAKLQKFNVWDIIFLNKDLYKGLIPSSRLMKGTILHIPLQEDTQASKSTSPTNWFIAKENDTPRKIAKQFGLPCKNLVAANRKRLPELMATSRLKEGTRIKVSNLDQHDDIANPYCHWSFPDDSSVEGGEPSYMMIYKLNRKTARNRREVRSSLAVPIKLYRPPHRLLPRPEPAKMVIRHPDAPKPPAEPRLAMDIFKDHLRELHTDLNAKTRANETVLEEQWIGLTPMKQERYNSVAMETRKHYDRAYEQYEVEYSLWEDECATRKPTVVLEKEASLFNKVIKLRDNALEGEEYSYWFVLTYIPDLKWCHLAPMVKDGVFGPEQKRSNGRTKWRLVDENLGKELDISSTYCVAVRSKALKRTADADKEEWDILDGDGKSDPPRSRDVCIGDVLVSGSSRPIRKQPIRARAAVKPMGGKLTVIRSSTQPAIPIVSHSENPRGVLCSPLRNTSSSSSHQPFSPRRRRPHSGVSPTAHRTRTSPPRVSLRSTPDITATADTPNTRKRRQQSQDHPMTPPNRKARQIHNAGARRCALQQS